jgi:hypothetical protein
MILNVRTLLNVLVDLGLLSYQKETRSWAEHWHMGKVGSDNPVIFRRDYGWVVYPSAQGPDPHLPPAKNPEEVLKRLCSVSKEFKQNLYAPEGA